MADGSKAPDELVAAYWEYHRLSNGDRGERLASADLFWAWQTVEDLISSRDTDAVGLLVALADAVEGDEAALAYLGAGPAETLLRSGPLDNSALDALDAAATASSNLRITLRCVWWSDDDDHELRHRFSRFGPPL